MTDIETVRNEMHKFVDTYLDELKGLEESDILKLANTEQINKLSEIDVPTDPRPLNETMAEMRDEIYDYRAKLNHPRFFGFVPGPASLESWAGEVMTSAFNMHAANWMTCPTASYIEEKLITWLGTKIGYDPDQVGGIFVSGGSLANLTAVVAARESKIAADKIHLATAYISKQTHSSLIKALKIAGISPENIRILKTDDDYEMDVADLKATLQADIDQGLIPFMIIATSGTTNTGSVDPLHETADIAAAHNMWFHVDGAYGASVLLSDKYRHLLDGIERADSVSWDGHKWLYQTYGCGMVLVKDKFDLVNAFSEHPEYLRDFKIKDDEINFADYGIELTRPARALKLWLTLQTMGTDKINDSINHNIELAKLAKKELQSLDHWEIVSEPEMAIINFRFSPESISEEEKDRINELASKQILAENYAGVFTTILHDQVVLRICTINPATTAEDIKTTIHKLDEIANRIVSE